MQDVHIIAEAGTNHNGNFATAKKLIDIAKKANAHSVKFQIIYPEGLYLPGEYEFGHYDIKEVIAMRKKFMLKDEEYIQLGEYCNDIGIKFTASVFDQKSLDLLTELKPSYIKIASTDLNNISFLRKVIEKGIKTILSTGMSSLSDIENTVNEITKTGFNDLVLMHCVSAYPAKLEDMNLGFIDTLRSAFGFPVGLSDHTQGSIAACMALVKDISYIEKHFTQDRTQEGFDHKYAMEENQLIEYVKNIQKSMLALDRQKNKLGKDELYIRKRARRSLYAARDITKGEIIEDKDILVVRPEGIMNASDIDLLVGKMIQKDIKQYQAFSLNFIF
ncbi:MAG: N-acetylneuraminate synthase family protein [Bacteroidales bacterium]|nr:N-acetylneuraminate synthase family protein [Bacteroidales bacterium]